jgi:hypothetical protein
MIAEFENVFSKGFGLSTFHRSSYFMSLFNWTSCYSVEALILLIWERVF